MFVIIISFPPVKPGQDEEFKKWFAESNREFAAFKGFIRRRLLKPETGGDYTAIAEFENRDAFTALHSSAIHGAMGEKTKSLFDGAPTPVFYDVIAG